MDDERKGNFVWCGEFVYITEKFIGYVLYIHLR